jgi:general L-amino acid transport system substrate-binding protein
MRKRLLYLLPLLAAALVVRAQDTATAPPGPTLTSIQARGLLICGVDEEVFGFGFLNPNTGEISGLQVDFCRALAAATTGEAAAVDLRLHTIDTPPVEILDDGADVIFHHTFILDPGQLELGVGQAVTFYDGTSVMVEASSEITRLEDLQGATICIQAGSRSAESLAVEMNRLALAYETVAFSTIAEMRAAFEDGRCAAQAIYPLLRYGDKQWADIVDWTLEGLVQAEKLGITSQTIDQFVRRPDESDEAYLGRVGGPAAHLIDPALGLGGRLGLAGDYMAQVIRQVGNYAEIYDRNLGPDRALVIERGLNSLWRDGGLLDVSAWH